MNEIVTEAELKERWEISQRTRLIQYMIQKGIRFEKTPRGKIWTVQKAIDQAVIHEHVQEEGNEDWDFEHPKSA